MNNIKLLEKNITPNKMGLIQLSSSILEKIDCCENSIIVISVISGLILLHKFSMRCVLCNNIIDQVAKNNKDYICYKCINDLREYKAIKCINLNNKYNGFLEQNLTIPYYTCVKTSHIYIPNYILYFALAYKEGKVSFNLYYMDNCIVLSPNNNNQ